MSDRDQLRSLGGSALPGPLVTARELAALIGISTGALMRWTRAGRVPSVKLPSGAVRFRPAAIEAWLDSCSRGAAGRGVVGPPAPTAPDPEPTSLPFLPSDHPAASSSAATDEEEPHAC